MPSKKFCIKCVKEHDFSELSIRVMTKQEFMMKQQAMVRRGTICVGIGLAILFPILIGFVSLGRYVEQFHWLNAAIPIGMLAVLLGSLALLGWFAARQQRHFGHRCPHCKKALTGSLARIAIATGNCGCCGEKVFGE